MSVLIIDDDAAFSVALAGDLQRMGFAAQVATSLEAMIDILLKAIPHVAIVDAHLADGDSRHVVTMLRRCSIPIVLVYENDASESRWLGADITGDVTMTKPIGLVDLEYHLRQLRRPGSF